MSRYFTDEIMQQIAALGYDIYEPIDSIMGRTYAFYTDGKRIGYIQRGLFGAFTVSTVHMPSRYIGSGTVDSDAMFYTINKDDLERGFSFTLAPLNVSERNSLRKYDNIDHWLSNQARKEYQRTFEGVK